MYRKDNQTPTNSHVYPPPTAHVADDEWELVRGETIRPPSRCDLLDPTALIVRACVPDRLCKYPSMRSFFVGAWQVWDLWEAQIEPYAGTLRVPIALHACLSFARQRCTAGLAPILPKYAARSCHCRPSPWDECIRAAYQVASFVLAVAATRPYMTGVGNHESFYSFSAFVHRWMMPTNGNGNYCTWTLP